MAAVHPAKAHRTLCTIDVSAPSGSNPNESPGEILVIASRIPPAHGEVWWWVLGGPGELEGKANMSKDRVDTQARIRACVYTSPGATGPLGSVNLGIIWESSFVRYPFRPFHRLVQNLDWPGINLGIIWGSHPVPDLVLGPLGLYLDPFEPDIVP